MKLLWKRLLWIALALAAAALLVRSFRPMPILVDAGRVEPGLLRVTVDDDGRTRVRERYTVSAPIDGRLLRSPLDPGDAVRAEETVVAEFAPVAAHLLDPRSRAEAEARERRAAAALEEASAREAQAVSETEFRNADLKRIEPLVRDGVQSADALDRARRDQRTAAAALRAAHFAVQVARHELELARASLATPPPPDETPLAPPTPATTSEGAGQPSDAGTAPGASVREGLRLFLSSPIEGRVLRVFEESARTLPAGTPILEIGNTSALEVVAEYLSQDAVRVRPGMDVAITGWAGAEDPRVLRGRVRLVEPGGFTKVSALGVEEQRVNVLVDPLGDEEVWSALGDGYRVELSIVLWEADDVLQVPTGALFRNGEDWNVFAIEGERAVRRSVRIGRRNGLAAEVLSGLAAGEEVVLYPSELIEDGARLEVRR